MIVDATSLGPDVERSCDVAIVGSGPAGLTLAIQLADAGAHVTLIEVGGDACDRRDERELRGRSVGTPFPLVPSRSRGFGGTSLRWTPETGLRTRPLDEVDFEPLAARPGASWPFGRDALDTYYRRAADLLGISDRYETSAWYDSSHASELAGEDGDGLAFFQFADNDVFTRKRQQVAESPLIDLVLRTAVASVAQSDSGAVSHLEVVGPGRSRFRVNAKVYVLACGAIENSRLLLDSPGRTGAGVGNEHDQVGRYFMDHISVDSGVVVGAPNKTLDVSAFLHHQNPLGLKFQPMLWAGDEAIRDHELLNAGFWVNRLDASYLSDGVDAARSLRNGLRVTPKLPDAWHHTRRALAGGRDIARFVFSRFGRGSAERACVSLRILAEQVPDPDSRITLGTERDSSGRRRVVLDWRVCDTDRNMIRRHQDLLADTLERRGVGTIVDRLEPDGPLPLVMSNHHHLGGTRMHADERHGVVDADGRVHSVSNLFVAGSSVFPAGGYLNPTLTIIALAIRMADRIRKDLAPAIARRG